MSGYAAFAMKCDEPFQLIAGHAALDFVNTVDNRGAPERRAELIHSYKDLLRFAKQCALLDVAPLERLRAKRRSEAEAACGAAIELRESLAGICYKLIAGHTPESRDVAILNRSVCAAAEHRRVQYEMNQFVWHWTDLGSNLNAPGWLLAFAAAELLISPAARLIRACESSTCRWLFLDRSKNHSRRWCDMKMCGNRTKVRRFYQRRS
ncbi:MAG TPA: CGNR zinc finger domain-containing protein [Bryobacteraceae bacterium]|jgi:predicted RNA-binding Zn ribbon-like protein|nr:CGNR zinc finger domain-containing protein [Bryobacteraceae bacterium]